MAIRKEHKFIKEIEYKECGRCKQWLVLLSFNKDKSYWDRLASKCRN